MKKKLPASTKKTKPAQAPAPAERKRRDEQRQKSVAKAEESKRLGLAPNGHPVRVVPIQHTIKAFSRFSDLQQLGLFRNRMTLQRAIQAGLFPPGQRLAGARIWTRNEILQAIRRLPRDLAAPPPPPPPKSNAGRPRQNK